MVAAGAGILQTQPFFHTIRVKAVIADGVVGHKNLLWITAQRVGTKRTDAILYPLKHL